MSKLEFWLGLTIAGMVGAVLAWGMWSAMASSSIYGTERAHSIIKTFPILFAGVGFLAWHARFIRKGRIAARLYFGLAASVPIWGWIIVGQMWELIRKMK